MGIIKRQEEIEYKNSKFMVELEYYYDEDLEEFYVDEKLGNENLRTIRNEYRRKNGLLLDYNIKQIRESYGLSQKDFALLLGLGEVTITRYESKTIQDKAQDEMIRNAKNPEEFLRIAINNKEKYINEYNVDKFNKVLENIKQNISNNYIELQYSRNKYPDDLVGNQDINLNKIFALIKYLSQNIVNLTKTKLAKLLWYSDFLTYKKYNRGITGLAYCHLPYGAVPYLYDELINDKKITCEIEYKGDSEKYLIKDCKSDSELSIEELEIINEIISKFKDMNTKEVVKYMHKETAYLETSKNEYISYRYAEKISI